MPFFDDTSFADIPLKQMPTSFFSMVYFPKGVATVMWCLVFSTTPYTVPDEACFTCSATLFTAFATSVLSLFAKLVVVAATTIINEIIIFIIPYYILKGLYFMFLVPRFFLFYRFPITSAKVRRLFLSAKYLNLPCMKCHSVCTK